MSPWYPEWYMINGGYTAPTASVPANFTIPFVSVIVTSPTEATIVAGSPITIPGSYSGTASTEANFSGFSAIDHRPFTNADGIVFLTGLLPGIKYYLRVRAHSGTSATGTYGEYIYESFTMPKLANVASTSSSTSSTTTPKTTTTDEQSQAATKKILAEEAAAAAAASGVNDNLDLSNSATGSKEILGTSTAFSGNRLLQGSFLKISNLTNDPNKYSVAIKNTGISTSYKKYSFGTGILFQPPKGNENPKFNSGGIGFFTNSTGTNGYYVELQTDQSQSNTKDRSLKIYKIVNTKRIYLQDSQDNDSGRLLGGVLRSTIYKLDVDVSVKPSEGVVIIDVYVNNFKISAVDTTVPSTTDPKKTIISPTSNIALFSKYASTSFDYVYANPVSDTQITDASSRKIYDGKYSTSTIDFTFGEKIAQDFGSPETKLSFIEEFGKTAREIRHVKANFTQSAAIPLYASTGINKFATILGSKFSNHGAEIFVINNAGAFIPLSYGNEQQFFVLGNYVDNGSQHEYTEPVSESTPLEPATFQSMWIQSESDAKALYGWIKNQWSKQQQSVNMEIFGNPAIEVGDIITINYPKNDLDGTKKFLVTNVNTSFDEGVSTSITARSIYSA
jgi:hypothetical protein